MFTFEFCDLSFELIYGAGWKGLKPKKLPIKEISTNDISAINKPTAAYIMVFFADSIADDSPCDVIHLNPP